MASFALMTEGITDQVILEKLIYELCSEAFDDDIDVRPIQPTRDETDKKQGSFAGWTLLFEACRVLSEDALATNDYVVIHVDTDEGDKEGFNLPLTIGGVDRPYYDIIVDAEQILIGHIGRAIYDANKDRFIFAIPVLSTESWLLYFHFNKDHTKNCLNRLVSEIQRVDSRNHSKCYDDYFVLAKKMKKKNLTLHEGAKNSFGIFVAKLMALSP